MTFRPRSMRWLRGGLAALALSLVLSGCGGGGGGEGSTSSTTPATTATATSTTPSTASTASTASVSNSPDSVVTPPPSDALTAEMAALQAGGLSTSRATPPRLPLGGPIPDLSATDQVEFNAGVADFTEHESLATTGDPVGPILNGVDPKFIIPQPINDPSFDVPQTTIGCATCHAAPVPGSGADQIETRAGKLTDGVFSTVAANGTLFHDEFFAASSASATPKTGPDSDPFFPDFYDPFLNVHEVPLTHGDIVPTTANVVAGRMVTPLFGFGLIEAIPDAEIEEVAALQARLYPNQAGQVITVDSPAFGASEIGRFGWKCQEADLLSFSGDAYFNEMDVSNAVFAFKTLAANSAPVAVSASDLDDQGTAPSPSGRLLNDNGKRDIDQFTNFMRFLAPAQGTDSIVPATTPTLILPDATSVSGYKTFQTIGCAVCHLPFYTTSSPIVNLNNKVVFAFSDFLAHDVFPDNIEQGNCPTNKTRTSPLMGLVNNQAFMHDGSAHTVNAAIMEHGGEAAASRAAFGHLSAADQANLLEFLRNI